MNPQEPVVPMHRRQQLCLSAHLATAGDAVEDVKVVIVEKDIEQGVRHVFMMP
jgi:hypothetical protein